MSWTEFIQGMTGALAAPVLIVAFFVIMRAKDRDCRDRWNSGMRECRRLAAQAERELGEPVYLAPAE